MSGLRLWRIADKVVTSFFVTAEKNKDYKYIYDPEHKKNPGEGFEKTKSGWTKGKKDVKPEQSASSEKPPVVITEEQKAFIKDYYKDGKFDAASYVTGMGNFVQARKEIDEKYGNISSVESKIHAYSGSQYGEAKPAQTLSILASYAFGMEKGDYHTNWVKGEKPSDKELDNFKKYIEKEQEVLKRSGLVTQDGKVRLYRNVGHSLFKYHEDGITYDNFEQHYGASFEYRGAHIESWTFNPNMSWSGAKIYAEVPLESVIASYIGRQYQKNMFAHQGEHECMVVASMVKEVTLVGKDGYCVDSAKKKYYSDISDDMGSSPDDYAVHAGPQSKEVYEKFNQLVKSDKPEDKIEAMSSPLCKKEMIDKFAEDENEEVRAVAAKSPKLSTSVLKKLVDDKSEKVQQAVIANPGLDYDDFEKLAKSPYESVSGKAQKEIQKVTDKYVQLAKGSEKQKQEAAVSKFTPIDTLKELANDSSDYVKKYVADNPRTPEDVLDTLADKNEHIQKSVAENPNTKPETLKKITDKSLQNINKGWVVGKVINSLAENKNTPSESLDAISKKGTPTVKIAVAKNPNTSKETLDSLYDDCFPDNKASRNYALQDALVSNKNLSAETIEKACQNQHLNADTKAKFIDYPNISVNALKAISTDSEMNDNSKTKASEKLKTMLKETSEAISDDEVDEKDIAFLKKYFPESCKGKSMDELIILFKTLAKRGYFSGKGKPSAEPVTETKQPEQEELPEEDEEMSDEDKSIMDYLGKFM